MLTAQRKKIEKTPKSINSGLFKIDCNETRNLCINSSRNSLKKSQNILLKIIRERLEYCRAWASKSVRMLGTRVFTVEEYVEQKISLQEVNEKISEVKRNLDLIGQLYNLGLKSEIGLATEDSDLLVNTVNLMSILNGYIINIESTNDKNMSLYKKKLKAMIPDFLQDVQAVTYKIHEDKYLVLESNHDAIIEDLNSLVVKCESFSETAAKICRFQEVLQEPVSFFHEVSVLCEEVKTRHKL